MDQIFQLRVFPLQNQINENHHRIQHIWIIVFQVSPETEFFFFLSGFSFTDTDDSQDSRGREGTIFYSTLPLPPAHEHWDIYLQLWLSRIFNCNTCVYQTATRWDLPPYRITIWLIDDVTLSFCLWIFRPILLKRVFSV